MPTEAKSKPEVSSEEAAQQVAGAHALLKVLEAKIERHPEIGQAIHKLEVALNILGVKTAAML
jgi:hypothetical protein